MSTYTGTPRTWVSGETVTAALLNSDVRDPLAALAGAWNSYTPTLTASSSNPTLGSGSTTTGRYTQVGKAVEGYFNVTFGTSGTAAGSGDYRISVPASISSNYNGQPIGRVAVFCGTSYGYFDLIPSSTYMLMRYAQAWPTGTLTTVTHAAPAAWTTSNYMRGWFSYEAS